MALVNLEPPEIAGCACDGYDLLDQNIEARRLPPTIFLSCFDCFNRTIQNTMQLLARQVCRHVSRGAFGDPVEESGSLPFEAVRELAGWRSRLLGYPVSLLGGCEPVWRAGPAMYERGGRHDLRRNRHSQRRARHRGDRRAQRQRREAASFPNSTDGFDRRRSTSKVWASLRNPRSSAWRRPSRSSSPSPASATSSALESSPR